MKTVAIVVVKSPKVFQWLGHMPMMNWALDQLNQVRGVDTIVCVASPELVAQAKRLLSEEGIEVIGLPKAVNEGKEAVLDAWLTAAGNVAGEADYVVLVRPTAPLMPAAKIEACLSTVRRKKCAACVPARPVTIVSNGNRAKFQESAETVRAFAVKPPVELSAAKRIATVPVSLLESLDVDDPDEYVMVSALVDAGKV